MHQKQCLTRKRDGAAIPHFTEPQFRNLCAGARGFAAPAPVRHAVHAANRVGSETLHGTRRRRCPAAQVLSFASDMGRQPEDRRGHVIGCRCREDAEGDDGDQNDGKVRGFGDSGHGRREASFLESSPEGLELKIEN